MTFHFKVLFMLIVLSNSSSHQIFQVNPDNTKEKCLFERSKRQTSAFNDESSEKFPDNEKCFDEFCLPKGYNRLIPPSHNIGNNDTKKPVDVHLDFDIRVFGVNDIKFTVSLTMYFGIRWQEPRLLKNKSNSYDGTFERVDLDMLQDLWLPSVYILNLKSYKTLNVFSDFAGKVFSDQF